MGKISLSRVVGAAGAAARGYVKGDAMRRDREQDEEDRRMRRESHEITLKRAQREDAAATRAEADNIALRNAAVPAAVTLANDVPNDDDGNPMPAVPQHRVETGEGVQRFDTREQADAAAAAHNDPVALSNRVSTTLAAQGKPTEALQYQEQASKFADAKWERDLREAMGKGHTGIAEFLTRTQAGPLKGKSFKAVPSEDGSSVTYHMVGEDGTSQPTPYTLPNDQKGVIQAGYQLSRISPEVRYKHMVDEDRRTAAAEAKERDIALRERLLTEVRIPQAEATIALRGAQAAAAEARATRAGAGGSDSTSREERLRWTSLHAEAGRRLSEANKSLNTLRGDPVFMAQSAKPGSQQARQLADLQADVEQHKSDREMYGGLLAGSQGAKAREERAGGKEAPAPGKPGTGKPDGTRANPFRPASKAEYEKLPPGAHYIHPTKGPQVKG
jgi:hypothetical protein